MPWLAPVGTPAQPPMIDSHIACCAMARAARSRGSRLIAGRLLGQQPHRLQRDRVGEGLRGGAHQRSTA